MRRAAAAAVAEHAREVALARAPVDNGTVTGRQHVGESLCLRPLAARDANSQARRQPLLRARRESGLESLARLQHRRPKFGALRNGVLKVIHAVRVRHDPLEGTLPPQRRTSGEAGIER